MLDVIAYGTLQLSQSHTDKAAIARTLHISLRSLRVPHSPPPLKSNSLPSNPSVVPLTPSASALSLIPDSGSETEGDEAPRVRASAERRRSEKGLQMTDLAGSSRRSEGLRMRKLTRPEPRPEQGLALELSPSPAPSTISNVSALSQFSIDSSASSSLTSTPTIEISTSKEPPLLGPPVSIDKVDHAQTAYPSPPLSPARKHPELIPVGEVTSTATVIPTESQ